MLSDYIVVDDGWSIHINLISGNCQTTSSYSISTFIRSTIYLASSAEWLLTLEHNEEKIRERRSEKFDSSILKIFSYVPKC